MLGTCPGNLRFWAGRSPFPEVRDALPWAESAGAGQIQRADVCAHLGGVQGGWEQGGREWREQGPARGIHGGPPPLSAMCPRRRGCSETPVCVQCSRPGSPAAPASLLCRQSTHCKHLPSGCWGSLSWSFLLLTGTSSPFYYPQRTSGNTLGSVWLSQWAEELTPSQANGAGGAAVATGWVWEVPPSPAPPSKLPHVTAAPGWRPQRRLCNQPCPGGRGGLSSGWGPAREPACQVQRGCRERGWGGGGWSSGTAWCLGFSDYGLSVFILPLLSVLLSLFFLF